MFSPPFILHTDRQIDRVLRERSIYSGDVTLDTTSDHGHHADIERRELDSQRVAVRVQSGFGCVVRRSEHVRHHTGQTAYLDDGTLRFDEQRREGLTHAHDGEDVDVERLLYLVEVEVESGDGIIATGVVDEVV